MYVWNQFDIQRMLGEAEENVRIPHRVFMTTIRHALSGTKVILILLHATVN